MARRIVSGRQKYVMWSQWKSCSSIAELCQTYGLSKNKIKRILRKYRKAHEDRQYSKTIDKYAKKHNVSWDEELEHRAKMWQRREKKRVELGIYHGAEPQNFLGAGRNRKLKWRY